MAVVLRELNDIICVPLAIIYRKSLQLGTPESWRIGHVVPIHKSGGQQTIDQSLPTNYRPVTTYKVLESLFTF